MEDEKATTGSADRPAGLDHLKVTLHDKRFISVGGFRLPSETAGRRSPSYGNPTTGPNRTDAPSRFVRTRTCRSVGSEFDA